jgi:hypothetical protein
MEGKLDLGLGIRVRVRLGVRVRVRVGVRAPSWTNPINDKKKGEWSHQLDLGLG